MEIKITKDKYVWKIITHEQAKKIYEIDLFEIYKLYSDDAESLICDDEDFNMITDDDVLAISVGFIEE